MGITTGYCTVGNFGSEQRLDYTVLGSPVNLAARLQGLAPADGILVSEPTYNLIREYVECAHFDELTPKGFARPIQIYQVKDFISEEHREGRRRLSRSGADTMPAPLRMFATVLRQMSMPRPALTASRIFV